MLRASNFDIRLRPRMVKYDGEENCSICFEKMKSGRQKMLPCGHFYHPACINKWKKTSCPLCRASYKYTMIHCHPFQVRWYADSVYREGYTAPNTKEEYDEMWDEIDDYIFFFHSRKTWASRKDRPRAYYQKVLRQLRKKVRRKKMRRRRRSEMMEAGEDDDNTISDFGDMSERELRMLDLDGDAASWIIRMMESSIGLYNLLNNIDESAGDENEVHDEEEDSDEDEEELHTLEETVDMLNTVIGPPITSPPPILNISRLDVPPIDLPRSVTEELMDSNDFGGQYSLLSENWDRRLISHVEEYTRDVFSIPQLRNLVPVHDRMVGDYFTMNITPQMVVDVTNSQQQTQPSRSGGGEEENNE